MRAEVVQLSSGRHSMWNLLEAGEVLIEAHPAYDASTRGTLLVTDRRVLFTSDEALTRGAYEFAVPLHELGRIALRPAPLQPLLRGCAIELGMRRSPAAGGVRLQTVGGGARRGRQLVSAIEAARARNGRPSPARTLDETPLVVYVAAAVAEWVQSRGGRLYVWTEASSRGASVLRTSVLAPSHDVVLASYEEVAGFELLLSEDLVWVSCLRLDLGGRWRPRVVATKAATWDD